jgi:hypothetical protein
MAGFARDFKCESCCRDGLIIITGSEGSEAVGITSGFSYRDRTVYCDECNASITTLPSRLFPPE